MTVRITLTSVQPETLELKVQKQSGRDRFGDSPV